MKTSTVNISFNRDLLEIIDRVALSESRSRSELIREAARMYIERKDKWDRIFTYGESRAAEQGLKEEDILTEIKQNRQEKKW
ncbi:MAG: ribbon-helix-helix protein, CopG family [Dethiobacter sp.]|jgi:metal-responsive CopG/Arc/MetJ family transcriptional regulator|nr:MAG: ribbon-helix-helix protein, CopG family [Dethiobacter sp.]